ncbi:hypothetical protein [Kutzneria albida]|uniref:Uncharacterized protein n=1 Tax=Kutzneria albida DSM 43870 TaxID=1449976 RepID=W5W921_9PSEU|nr:hypothetical protein [Kutzneria albida]AHH97235.1 hypothetical protein KALB_3871 [Kutzneria albida DSM 43870]
MVRVSRVDHGAVRITGSAGGGVDFTRAVLDVAGAVLSWPDVTDLGVPDAEIEDVADAQQWIWAVYGEPVALAVQACASGEIAEASVESEQTGLGRLVARLAYGHWAARWWPASRIDAIPALAEDLLGLELAALTHECQQLFTDSPEAAELIEQHQGALEPLIQWWRAGGSSAAERVLRSIDEAADAAGLDGEPLRQLRSALDGPGTTELAASFPTQEDFALAAGEPGTGTGRVVVSGVGVNDWRRYPPGFVDAAEDAVTWAVRAVGARRRIEILAAAGEVEPAPGVRLAAEVRVDASPVERVVLARGDAEWTGGAEVPATSSSQVDVGVLLPGFDPGSSEDGRAERAAVRELARRRLAAEDRFLAEIVAADR